MEIISVCFNIALILWYILYILFIVYLSISSNGIYSVDDIIISSDVSLNDLSLIMYRKIKPEVLTASIVKLINDKKIELRKENNDFILIKKTDEDLSKADFNILELLFNIIGENNKVSLKEIDKFCETRNGCSGFLLNYEIWKKLMIVSSNKKDMFEPKLDYNKVKFFKYTGVILFILNFILKRFSIFGFIVIIPSIFISFYFYHISKLTEEASKKYYGFLKLRKDMKENNELLENNTYLEYSIVLKCFDNIHDKEKLEFVKGLDIAINKCYKKAFFNGNRSLFK